MAGWNSSEDGSGARAIMAPTSGRILLVDAQPDWLAFVAHVLARRGHVCATAGTETLALRLLAGPTRPRANSPDVVVVGLPGGATARVLRTARGAAPSVKTIAMTRDGSEVAGLPRGVVDLPLLRPVPIPSLVEAVESFLLSENSARR